MKFFYTVLCILFISTSYGQDDLLAELNSQQSEETQYTITTFNGSRVINGQSVEGVNKNELEFIFSHRFGRINSGAYNLWGLDDAFIRLGLEYGITDRLGISVGRSSTDKTFDGFLRYKFLRQSSGKKTIPVTVSGILTGYFLVISDLAQRLVQ